MRLIDSALDYINAVRKASENKIIRYPGAIYSVLAFKFLCGLGPRFHSLYNVNKLPRERWNDYLENDRMRAMLRSINKADAREVVNDKLMFLNHCLEHSLPTIPVICAILAETENSIQSPVIVNNELEWSNRLNDAPDQVFIKPIDGTWGRGAFVARKKAGQWSYSGVDGSTGELFQDLMKRMRNKRGWMVQPFVSSHEQLKLITSSRALPTVRANTCLVGDKPRLLYAVLRIPVGDSVTDNFAHGTTGNIIASINLGTGKLGKCLGSTNKNWPDIREISTHPDTGNPVEGFQIPMWDEVTSLLARAQRSLPELKTLGWDIAITDDGPIIVETNATYDIDIVQVAYQRGVRRDIEEIFGPVA